MITYEEAKEKLFHNIKPLGKECFVLESCTGRVLAQDVIAEFDEPPFHRSCMDGYAIRAVDTKEASKAHPVTLQILEEIPAGKIPLKILKEGCAAKILTGAPIPEGADAVIMYEQTNGTDETVSIFEEVNSGLNIAIAGTKIQCGELLIKAGVKIGPEEMGIMASQNLLTPEVYKRPTVGIISTGSELLPVGAEWKPGKIYESNRYMLTAVLEQIGCRVVNLGIAKDHEKEICDLIQKGLASCDAVVLTGGVSAGDYDLTPKAMELAGAEILFHGVNLKPGKACAYGKKDGKLICALSGKPAAALANFEALGLKAIKILCGYPLESDRG